VHLLSLPFFLAKTEEIFKKNTPSFHYFYLRMMSIISPAKKLNFKPLPVEEFTSIRFVKETKELVQVMRKKSIADIMKLMDISKSLGELNAARYKAFDPDMSPAKCKQALYAFNGDVYVGLKAEDFNSGDIKFAQKHLRILSGLYGLLRPLDNIQEYRLEMGCGLHVGKNKSLYGFWGDKITDLLIEDMKANKDKILLNLASEEYFESINTNKFNSNLVHVRFEEKRAGKYQVISFSAKKARGLMARYLIKNRILKLDDVKNFDFERYAFAPERSKENQFVFVR
jgi:cytoplasmic iron level regulating protein YaaA (DUF328/UPF0246 family)